MENLQDIYTPLQPYQTRIIHLHGPDGIPASPLVCDLYIADIVHATFEGLGVHLPSGVRLIAYNALSYTWGSSKTPAAMICNGVGFPIRANLDGALRALRDFEGTDQYLWVDAICINQSDNDEVSKQVSNMFVIYEKAMRVVA
jgi:hypothetical protein